MNEDDGQWLHQAEIHWRAVSGKGEAYENSTGNPCQSTRQLLPNGDGNVHNNYISSRFHVDFDTFGSYVELSSLFNLEVFRKAKRGREREREGGGFPGCVFFTSVGPNFSGSPGIYAIFGPGKLPMLLPAYEEYVARGPQCLLGGLFWTEPCVIN